MLYDRPVRVLLADAIRAMPAVFSRDDVDRWFDQNYPKVKHTTIQAHLVAGTVNSPTRLQYTMRVGDLVFKRDDRRYERFDPSRHGWWKDGKRVRPPSTQSAEPLEDDQSIVDRKPTPGVLELDLPRVRELLGARFAAVMERSVVEIGNGVTQGFDFVSEDERVVGTLFSFDAATPPEGRWSAISERVWLLQRAHEAHVRVLVIEGDRRIPATWLENLGRLAEDVDFLYLNGRNLVDLKGDT